MSKNAKDLAGLFATQKKGKKPTKKAGPVPDENEADETIAKAAEQEKVHDNSEQKADLEETKETTATKQTKVTAQKKEGKKKDFIHGSDDEDENLDLEKDQNIKIRTTAEVQAERIAQESKEVDMVNGFCLEPAAGQTQKEGPSMASAAVKAAPSDSSNIKFSGKPTFVNKKKQGTRIDNQDFPELGTVSEMQQKGSAGPKEPNSPAEEDFGPAHPFLSSAARSGGGPPRQEQSSSGGAPKMPFFTSSKKKNLGGGADLAEIANSKQNYDMSFLSSTVKGAAGTEDKKEGQEAGDQPRQPREPRQQNNRQGGGGGKDFGGNFSRGGGAPQMGEDDDGFEIVTSKKRTGFGTNQGVAEMSFGRPTFSRGPKQ